MNGIFDIEGALEKVEGDREFLIELAKIFLDEVSVLLVAMAYAMEQNNISAAAKKAHTIKGASANFCAQAIFDAAWEFEQMLPSNTSAEIAAAYEKLLRETKRLKQAMQQVLTI